MSWTLTEKKMLDVLRDGRPHSRQELHGCLHDDLGPLRNINQHISNLRRKIRERGEMIVCELVNRRIHYRHVKLLKSV